MPESIYELVRGKSQPDDQRQVGKRGEPANVTNEIETEAQGDFKQLIDIDWDFSIKLPLVSRTQMRGALCTPSGASSRYGDGGYHGSCEPAGSSLWLVSRV
jgi:hypothetical protein